MIRDDFRDAVRGVMRSGRVSAVSIVLLAIAVGGAGGLLSLFNAIVLKRLSVPAPHELVTFYPGVGEALLGIPLPTLAALEAQQRVFNGICGVVRGGELDVEVHGTTSRRPVEAFSGRCFAVLGAGVALGRTLANEDAPLSGPNADVVVLTHRFWRTLGQPPNILGSRLTVGGRPLEVIGVTTPEFQGLNVDDPPDLIIPLGVNAAIRGSRRPVALFALGRLETGSQLADADGQLRAVWPRVWLETNPGAQNARSPAAEARSLRVQLFDRGFSTLRNRYQDSLSLVVTLALTLLLLASAGVSGLFLVRAIARADEFRIRLAVGASVARLAWLIGLESVVIAACSAVLALLVAWWVSGTIAAAFWTGARPLGMQVTPDRAVAIAIVGTALLLGVLLSLPTLMLLRRSAWHALRFSGRAASPVRRVGGRALAIAQVAVSLVLLFAAVLFAANLQTIRRLNPGYETEGLNWTRLERIDSRTRAGEDERAYMGAVLERVSSLRQVSAATFSFTFPTSELRHVTALTSFSAGQAGESDVVARGLVDRVWPGFFSTTGIRVIRGREFDGHDDEEAPLVGIINMSMAKGLFGDRDPLGHTVRIGAAQRAVTIVGVVDTVSPGDFRIADLPILYRPLLQEPQFLASPLLIVRTASRDGLLADLQNAVTGLGRHRILTVRNSDQQMDRFLIRERMLSGLSVGFAGLGLLVCGVGLYSLLAYTVNSRVREFGLRMALGASQWRVIGMISRDGAVLVGIGLVLGSPAAVAVGRAAGPLLFEGSETAGPAAIALLTVLAAGGLAIAMPAYKTLRIQPAEALRAE